MGIEYGIICFGSKCFVFYCKFCFIFNDVEIFVFVFVVVRWYVSVYFIVGFYYSKLFVGVLIIYFYCNVIL